MNLSFPEFVIKFTIHFIKQVITYILTHKFVVIEILVITTALLYLGKTWLGWYDVIDQHVYNILQRGH